MTNLSFDHISIQANSDLLTMEVVTNSYFTAHDVGGTSYYDGINVIPYAGTNISFKLSDCYATVNYDTNYNTSGYAHAFSLLGQSFNKTIATGALYNCVFKINDVNGTPANQEAAVNVAPSMNDIGNTSNSTVQVYIYDSVLSPSTNPIAYSILAKNNGYINPKTPALDYTNTSGVFIDTASLWNPATSGTNGNIWVMTGGTNLQNATNWPAYTGTFTGSGSGLTNLIQSQTITVSNNFTVGSAGEDTTTTNYLYSIISNCIVTLPSAWKNVIGFRNDSTTNCWLTNGGASWKFAYASASNVISYTNAINITFSKRSVYYSVDPNGTNVSMVYGERPKTEIDAEIATQPNQVGGVVTGPSTNETFSASGNAAISALGTNAAQAVLATNASYSTNSTFSADSFNLASSFGLMKLSTNVYNSDNHPSPIVSFSSFLSTTDLTASVIGGRITNLQPGTFSVSLSGQIGGEFPLLFGVVLITLTTNGVADTDFNFAVSTNSVNPWTSFSSPDFVLNLNAGTSIGWQADMTNMDHGFDFSNLLFKVSGAFNHVLIATNTQNQIFGTFTGNLSGGTNLQATNVVNLTNNSAAVSMVGEDSTGHLTTNAVPSGGGTVYATNIVGVIPQAPTVTIANNDPATNLVMVTDASGNRWWSNAIPGGVSVPATNLVGTVPAANLPTLPYVANLNGLATNPIIYNPTTNIWTVLTVATNYVVSDGTNLYYVNASTNGVQTNEIETISSGNLTQTLTTTNKGTAYFNAPISFVNSVQVLNQENASVLNINGSSSSGIEELNLECISGRPSIWGLTGTGSTSSWLCTTNGGQQIG